MSIKSDVNLKAAFAGKKAQEQTQGAEVPAGIKRHAPAPVLKPDGGWQARAQAVDQRVREQHEAAQAKSRWAKRAAAKQGGDVRASFRKSAKR